MFTIVISEKGGAERREAFDKNEISVGRIQGNDLVLAKGNVSKHHARLLSRDGRFIVTDLKSTNGTYVNGRKTSQATIVREGDKIYVGDFVLRIETGQGSGAVDSAKSDPLATRGQLASGHDLSSDVMSSPTGGGAIAVGHGASMPPPMPDAGARPRESQRVSHYPLERDPDSESHPEIVGAALPPMPAPPRLPHADLRPAPRPLGTMQRANPVAPVRPHGVTPARPPLGTSREVSKEAHAPTARRLAFVNLAGRVVDSIDLAQVDESPTVPRAVVEPIERAVREQGRSMQSAGELPDGVDLDSLGRDVVRELVGFGPLEEWMNDADVSEIRVARADRVFVRKGETVTAGDPGFSSEKALERVARRLIRRWGAAPTAEGIVERRLSAGTLAVLGPPAAPSWIVWYRRHQQVEMTLQGLTSSGALSKAMAAFLEACVGARANVLVVGETAACSLGVQAALVSSASADESLALFQDGDELAVGQAQTYRFAPPPTPGRSAEALLRMASRMRVDRLVVTSLVGDSGPALLENILDGRDGVIAGMVAPSLKHGLARLVSRVVLAEGSTIGTAAAGESLGACFDVVIEVVQDGDAKPRISKIGELDGVDEAGVSVRDLFVATSEASGQVGFASTGNAPRLAETFASRGIRLDSALFRRAK